MMGTWGGKEGDNHYAGTLSIQEGKHFSRLLEDGSLMMMTAADDWNPGPARYIYVNLTEEQLSLLHVDVCDENGVCLENCLTRTLNLAQEYTERQNQWKHAAMEDELQDARKEAKGYTDEKTAALQTSLDLAHEALDKVQEGLGSYWKGKTINFIGDSITYGKLIYPQDWGNRPHLEPEMNEPIEKSFSPIATEAENQP